MECFKGSLVNVIEWTSKSPDLNPNKCLWRDLNMSCPPGVPNLPDKTCGITEICEVKGTEKISNSTINVL